MDAPEITLSVLGVEKNGLTRILPSVVFFLKVTPRARRRSCSFSTSSTEMAMCPKPRPGSEFPLL